MSDFLAALGLALVLEGVAYALFPAQMRSLMERAFASGDALMRRSGLVLAIVGVGIVWLVRG
ncbi:MAG: DUF2065 domain-containing protein [Pseudomonadota bacterium]